MTPIAPETVKEGSKALKRLSDPNVFAPAVVFLLLFMFSGFLYILRQDWHEESLAKIRVFNEMSDRLIDIHDHLIYLGAVKTEHDRAEEERTRAARTAHP